MEQFSSMYIASLRLFAIRSSTHFLEKEPAQQQNEKPILRPHLMEEVFKNNKPCGYKRRLSPHIMGFP